MDTDKETKEGGVSDELQDEIVGTLRYLQKAQKRLEIGLIIGFVLLYVWAQWPAICLLARWMWIWRPW